MKYAVLALSFVVAQAAHASSTCTVSADQALGGNFGTAIGYECPNVVVTAKAGLKLELVDGKKGMCKVKFELTTSKGSKLGLKFDGEKQDPMIGDGCSVKVTNPKTGETGLLEVAAVET